MHHDVALIRVYNVAAVGLTHQNHYITSVIKLLGL